MSIRTYSGLSQLHTFEERFRYLQLNGVVGEETFGFYRFINQKFYKSREWKSIRDFVILRDSGCDLGVVGYDINGRILIHHLNPISVEDIVNQNQKVLDPENLVCVSHNTHNVIHYGNEELLIRLPPERSQNDTCPWRH